jgi:hypothetical protein
MMPIPNHPTPPQALSLAIGPGCHVWREGKQVFSVSKLLDSPRDFEAVRILIRR